MIGKCRPETVTPELARELRALGVLRLYVGVENASEHGAGDLRRGTQWKAVDQALYAPPDASFAIERGDGFVRVRVRTGDTPASTRWEGDGVITGEGAEVRWEPAAGDDQLRVAVRTRGGVAVLALRAREVDGRRRSIAEIRDEA
jgi:hypothetical protein